MQFVNNTFGLSIYTDWSPENQKQFPFSVLIIAIKLLSSTFFLLKPSSKNYFEDFCSTLESAEVNFMHRIFNERSVLFLGCDLHRQEYKSFFQKFAVNAKVYTTNWGDKWKFRFVCSFPFSAFLTCRLLLLFLRCRLIILLLQFNVLDWNFERHNH